MPPLWGDAARALHSISPLVLEEDGAVISAQVLSQLLGFGWGRGLLDQGVQDGFEKTRVVG